MRYKIADLITEVPADGGMDARCREYLYDGDGDTDITIYAERYNPENWPTLSADDIAYMESGFYFYGNLLRYQGMMLHASAIELDGKAYLFSGDSGAGKSTHTGLYQQVFGSRVQLFNDDKPALRCVDGKWYAYGTPWSGKNHINQNKKVPLAGICFLKQAPENKIRRLSKMEMVTRIVAQTMSHFSQVEVLDTMLSLLNQLVNDIPVFELENRPEPEAVWMSYRAMCPEGEE